MAAKRYSKAKAKIVFKKGLETNIKIFRDAGVEENLIVEYKLAEKQFFNNERKYYENTISMTLYDDNLGDSEEYGRDYGESVELDVKNTAHIEELRSTKAYSNIRNIQRYNLNDCYRWIESLENIQRQEIIMSFTESHIYILTQVTQYGVTFEVIAKEMHTTRQRVSRMYHKVIDRLRPAYEYEYIKAQRRYEARKKRADEIKERRRELLNVEKRQL